MGHARGSCLEDALLDCTNPFSPVERICPFGCAHGTCLSGHGDQLILHTELQLAQTMPWTRNIPVCFADDAGAELRRWTRGAVTQGWTRNADVAFEGWGDCPTQDAEGVVIEFPRGCQGRLVSAVARTREASQLRVGICRSYFDAGGVERELADDETLARFLARHQFGHVLGLGEDNVHASVMVRTVRTSAIDARIWATDLLGLRDLYGYKNPGSVVHASGWCLNGSDGALTLASCSEKSGLKFVVRLDRVQAADGSCLVADGETAVALAACSTSVPSKALALRRASLRAAGHCVVPRTEPVFPGTVLEARPCGDIGNLDYPFHFELVGSAVAGRLAQIRFGNGDYCLAAPATFGGVAVPTLEPCSTNSSVFTLGDEGEISLLVPGTQSRRCLDYTTHGTSGSVIELRLCNGRSFTLTGPLETLDGLALSADPDEPAAGLSLKKLRPGEMPTLDETFDAHF